MAEGQVAGIAAVMEYEPVARGELAAVASVMEYEPLPRGELSAVAGVMEFVDKGSANVAAVAVVMEYREPEDGMWIRSPGFTSPGWSNSGYGGLGPVDSDSALWFHTHAGGGRYPREVSAPNYQSVGTGKFDVFSPDGFVDLSKFADTDRWEIEIETVFHFAPSVTGGGSPPGLYVGYRVDAGTFQMIGSITSASGDPISDDPGSPGAAGYWRKVTHSLPVAAFGEAGVQIGYRFDAFGPYTTTDPGPGICGVKVKIRGA